MNMVLVKSVAASPPSVRPLPPVHEYLDDFGRKEGERQEPADVAPVDALGLGNLADRGDRSGRQLIEPAVGTRDQGDQPVIRRFGTFGAQDQANFDLSNRRVSSADSDGNSRLRC